MNELIIRKGEILFNFLLKTNLKNKKISELTMEDIQRIVASIESKEASCR